MLNWLNKKTAAAAGAIRSVYARAQLQLSDERGDTNFISILIILGIVIILAGVFIGFKDQIVEQVQNIINGFTIQ
jgi:hypothetical protein